MKIQASWEDRQRAMEAAGVLAHFANLEPDGVESFRTDHKDFFPKAWWDYQPTDPNGAPLPKKQWQINQKFLRDAWLFEFDMELFAYVHLLTSVFDPEPALFGRLYRPAFVTGLEIGNECQDEFPYYLAVKWLGGQGWRAKTCFFCGKRFVAEHPKTQFCSFNVAVNENFNITRDGIEMSCFWAHRKSEKHAWWIDHSENINEQRRRDYHATKRRKGHAKRKSLRQR